MEDRGVAITFSPDEALLLSDWLHRVIGTERFDSFIREDPAVWSPLYRLHGVLETSLPDIFAADYGARVDAARARLRATLGEVGRLPTLRPGPPAPAGRAEASRADGPPRGAVRQVNGFIDVDHVVRLFTWVASFIGHAYDYLDEQALVGALDGTDDEADRWFEYPLLGVPNVTVRLARSSGSAVVMTQVYGDLDDVLAARIDTLIAVLASRH